MALTNKSDIPLSLAVWLASDDYDYSDDPKEISVTTLMKPIKQIVLGARVDPNTLSQDIEGYIPSRLGTAIHDSIEKSWKEHYQEALTKLGYPKAIISRIRINPSDEELKESDVIPVYVEQRTKKEIDGFIVSGKFDFVIEGALEDFKSTSTYTYQMGNKDGDYCLQGSMYRWLNPDKITEETMKIQFIFTDFQPLRAKTEAAKRYPPSRLLSYPIKLMSIPETESYIRNKLGQIKRLFNAPESELPECTDEDLWVAPPVYKYYKNPNNTTRSTKNYDNAYEANEHKRKDGDVGIVVEVKGEVKACRYCAAFPVCKQKDAYLEQGRLKL